MSYTSIPTTLVLLPTDIWTRFLVFLKLRQVARLFKTGDALVQWRLTTARRSFVFYHKKGTVPTPLQQVLMASSTDFLVADECISHSQKALARYPSAIRILRLTSMCDRIEKDFVTNPDFLSALTHLESLEYWHAWVSSTLILPKTLTHLSLKCDTANPVLGLESFASLTSLEIEFLLERYERAFLEEVKWPPNLVKLEYAVAGPNSPALLHLLPATLTDLTIRSDLPCYMTIDAAPFYVNYNKLTSLRFNVSHVGMGDGTPLPPALTRLKVTEICLIEPSTYVSLFNSFPSSLTDFTFKSLQQKDDDSLRDLALALALVLPRLSFKSLTSAMNYVLSLEYSLHSNVELRAIIATNLARFGLNDDYYELHRSTILCSSVHKVLFASSLPRHAIELYCRNHRSRLRKMDVIQHVDHPNACHEEMAWCFGLGDYVEDLHLCFVSSSTLPLPPIVCERVKRMTISGAEDNKVPLSLFSQPMPRLKSLAIHVNHTRSIDSVVESMYANRSYFPSLQRFDVYYASNLSTESRALLAKMRLYADLDSSELTYSVVPPKRIARAHPWLLTPPINQVSV